MQSFRNLFRKKTTTRGLKEALTKCALAATRAKASHTAGVRKALARAAGLELARAAGLELEKSAK